ncbi:MAG: hypothetical protein J5950_00605 [Clostridia bacterium]|nr:hypothetical protein [Clostridia bacterium]
MIELNAFFYENEYYLFPANVNSVPELREYIAKAGISDLRASLLSSDKCVPPCFTDNSVKESVIRDIDPRFIFPATVIMMKRDEYDEALRKRLREQCANCHRYNGDVSRLDDYYCETPLLYDCPDKILKEDFERTGTLKTGYEPVFSVDDFWNDFMKAAPGLMALIDSGKMREATAKVSEMIDNAGFSEYLFPALSRFTYTGSSGLPVHHYILMLTGGGFLCANLVASFFVKLAPDAVRRQWTLYPYVVRGLYSYWPGVADIDVSASPPMLRVNYLEQHDSFQVYVFADWDKDKLALPSAPDVSDDFTASDEDVPGIVFCANYLYLCGIIGEDRLRGACLELVMFPAAELVYDGNTVTPEEFDRMIDAQIRDRSKLLPEQSMKVIELEGVAELRNVSFVETFSDQLTFDLLLGGDNILSYVWDRDIATATLRLASIPDPDVLSYMRRELSLYVEEPGCGQLFDVCSGEDGVFFDLLLWDRFVAKRAIRRLAPLFHPSGASFSLTVGADTAEFSL